MVYSKYKTQKLFYMNNGNISVVTLYITYWKDSMLDLSS